MSKCGQCGAVSSDAARFCSSCGSKMPETDDNKPKKKPKNNVLLGIIVGVLGVWAMFLIVYQVFFSISTVDRQMMEFASGLNSACPMMVDQETRLDNAIAVPPRSFQYNYTLINFSKESTDTLFLKSQLEHNIINLSRTSPDMKFFRENKITMKYHYRDMNGNFLIQVVITPEQYSE